MSPHNLTHSAVGALTQGANQAGRTSGAAAACKCGATGAAPGRNRANAGPERYRAVISPTAAAGALLLLTTRSATLRAARGCRGSFFSEASCST